MFAYNSTYSEVCIESYVHFEETNINNLKIEEYALMTELSSETAKKSYSSYLFS